MDIGHGTLTVVENADREIILQYRRRSGPLNLHFGVCILSVYIPNYDAIVGV